MILSPDRSLCFINRDRAGDGQICAVDGRKVFTLEKNETLFVRRSARKARFVLTEEGFFFNILRKKLID